MQFFPAHFHGIKRYVEINLTLFLQILLVFADEICLFQVKDKMTSSLTSFDNADDIALCIVSVDQHKDHVKNELKTFYCNSKFYHIPKLP